MVGGGHGHTLDSTHHTRNMDYLTNLDRVVGTLDVRIGSLQSVERDTKRLGDLPHSVSGFDRIVRRIWVGSLSRRCRPISTLAYDIALGRVPAFRSIREGQLCLRRWQGELRRALLTNNIRRTVRRNRLTNADMGS
ncbi:hypothetical protein BAUCODRAFT_227761 [Baudoinia panamericana UAMH 10762]|uniref:Uncharacterized protein n=1 Tax=Baudoinia panamericana (strain UAMH 10762) TaxID=717646 RepID=M2LJ77_BAUPA|nr:uncharacterized protein BAUCODRAFT_227761 [Baudoinia panamericana UAMH 10762]EMC94287.1 hypothetical protein BAUCODRAFT_227761 [Baudoinia panamericana UAMH 10762]